MGTPFNILSLCSGGGGLDDGLRVAIESARTICWVEWEAFAIDFLASRMETGSLHPAPIWTDLRTFDGKPWRGLVDCITAGYPCQPFSLAGRRAGVRDSRHLWPHVRNVIADVEPTFVFLENVPGHLSLGYQEVEAELQGMDYQVKAGLFTASEVGSPQQRERLFILAHYQGDRHNGRSRGGWRGESKSQGRRREKPQRVSKERLAELPLFPPGPEGDWSAIPEKFWPSHERGVCGLVDGLEHDRARLIKLLGNGVVPAQAAYAFLSLWSALS